MTRWNMAMRSASLATTSTAEVTVSCRFAGRSNVRRSDNRQRFSHQRWLRRRLPWGFQVVERICCGDVLSPSHLPGGFLKCERVLVVDRRVRETSLSQRITFRQSGNPSGGRPQTALSGGGDPTERHLPTRQECR